MDDTNDSGAFEGLPGDRRKRPREFKRTHRPPRRKRPGTVEKTISRQRQPLTACARCGAPLPPAASTGRPRVYCSPACRKAAYEDRRAGRDTAVKVQLVDRVVVETVEKRIQIDHPRVICVETVLANPHAIREVLIGLSRLVGSKKITPNDEMFWDLVTSTEFLTEALGRAANRGTGGQDGRKDGRRPS